VAFSISFSPRVVAVRLLATASVGAATDVRSIHASPPSHETSVHASAPPAPRGAPGCASRCQDEDHGQVLPTVPYTWTVRPQQRLVPPFRSLRYG